jgi:hypothetical protein
MSLAILAIIEVGAESVSQGSIPLKLGRPRHPVAEDDLQLEIVRETEDELNERRLRELQEQGAFLL